MDDYETWSALNAILCEMDAQLHCKAKPPKPNRPDPDISSSSDDDGVQQTKDHSKHRRREQDMSSSEDDNEYEFRKHKARDDIDQYEEEGSEDESEIIVTFPDGGSDQVHSSPKPEGESDEVEDGKEFQYVKKHFRGFHNLCPHTGMKKRI